ncbi:MAG TPA: hypothetical protein VGM80_07935 [Gaiellaceae bacterium]
MRRVGLLLATAALAGCGGGSKPVPTTPAAPDPAAAMRALISQQPSLAGIVRTLAQGSSWSIVESISSGSAHAVAFRLVKGAWVADQSGRVKIEILGPAPEAHAPILPQIAIEFKSTKPFTQSALWIDGTELQEKGGGSPTEGTIYGAPAHDLKPGPHVAVGFASTATAGTAVAWIFSAG